MSILAWFLIMLGLFVVRCFIENIACREDSEWEDKSLAHFEQTDGGQIWHHGPMHYTTTSKGAQLHLLGRFFFLLSLVSLIVLLIKILMIL